MSNLTGIRYTRLAPRQGDWETWWERVTGTQTKPQTSLKSALELARGEYHERLQRGFGRIEFQRWLRDVRFDCAVVWLICREIEGLTNEHND